MSAPSARKIKDVSRTSTPDSRKLSSGWLLLMVLMLALPWERATASTACRDLLRVSERVSTNFPEFFQQNIIAPEPENDLDFRWNIPYPSNGDRWGGKPNRDYVSRPLDPQAPLVGIARLFGSSAISTRSFYDEAYAHYEGRFRDELIRNLKAIDTQLDRDRTSLGVIREAPLEHGQLGTVVGTFRAYDGSAKPWGLFYENEVPWAPNEGSALPFQRINKMRGIARLPLEDELVEKIKKGEKVFELGKFSIETTPAKQNRVRNLIEGFWLEYIIKSYPDQATYIAHVAGPVHARLYARRYGFKVVETFAAPGATEPEMIMRADGATLKRHLNAIFQRAPREAPAAKGN